ncbi:MAG: 30S ribosomal protein S18 [Candidatus Niyogibacteria bacterium]|nr:30S ribosomal protein S18 [Candidatus Niyogibacteria bacterium]
MEKQCYFCTSSNKAPDYKDADTLRKFINPQSKIMPRKRTGMCALHQRKLARAIKHARELAVIPYTSR